MEIIKSIERIPKTRMHKIINILWSILFLIATLLIAMGLTSCSKDEPKQDPNPLQNTGWPSTDFIRISNGERESIGPLQWQFVDC